eukprot:TRINITY_DN696_c0_g1::TRINITY_DN696_c0_g1_i1::g.28798::m.28798 TRINITY_DN696_c0_g1::TRINITY_DN696_c0_g1_i1::g.28798  ORF type:complete len:141 (-),score=-33.50,ABC2_membrane_3/PF12698.2/4.1 TRINITY_DN696_c0_g1_i1:217-639(-)
MASVINRLPVPQLTQITVALLICRVQVSFIALSLQGYLQDTDLVLLPYFLESRPQKKIRRILFFLFFFFPLSSHYNLVFFFFYHIPYSFLYSFFCCFFALVSTFLENSFCNTMLFARSLICLISCVFPLCHFPLSHSIET